MLKKQYACNLCGDQILVLDGRPMLGVGIGPSLTKGTVGEPAFVPVELHQSDMHLCVLCLRGLRSMFFEHQPIDKA